MTLPHPTLQGGGAAGREGSRSEARAASAAQAAAERAAQAAADIRATEEAMGDGGPRRALLAPPGSGSLAGAAGAVLASADPAALPESRRTKHRHSPPGRGKGRVWKERNFPGPPGGAPPNEYTYFLNSLVGNTTSPTRPEVENAKAALSRDFVVGLTEAMPSFLVLAAHHLGWPLHYLCCVPRNVNSFTGQSKNRVWRPELAAHAAQKLAADVEVYAEARRVHAEQVSAMGPSHGVALKQLTDPSFGRLVCKHDLT